ncbi:ATP-binding protein [uncultured Roseibium sp.]|uniref:ATP-binding protein n=1 Tax=uncultured Roseibium sp. TaxID=1936171 RepID=UPI0026285F29|nr:ATP-binding protein [uncultured Roseibium sp.]
MFKLITLDERLAQKPAVNICMFGEAGSGKTTQARTLPPEKTLFLDLEAGTLALGGWGGTVLPVKTWDEACMIASILHGPDPALAPDQKFSLDYYNYSVATAGQDFVSALDQFEFVFVDSITVSGRHARTWSEQQAENKTAQGKVDTRGVYGTLGTEVVRWIEKLQHIRTKSVIVVGGLETKVDDFGRKDYVPLIEGSKAPREIPYIFDVVLTLQTFAMEDGTKYRGFVTQQDNPEGYPAKDRSGVLDMIEQPDLYKLIQKTQNSVRPDTMNTTMPSAA